jgi:predicted ribosomally synthesized peptide with SipW-like signal peptide
MAKKKIMLLASGLMSLGFAAASATYAWFTATDKVNNALVAATLDSGIEIIETFDPPTEWKPGETVEKKAAVRSEAGLNMLVRVSFEESLELLSRPAKASSSPNGPANSVPALVGIAPFASWKDIKDSGLAVKGSIPNGVTVKALATEYPGAASYSFMAYRPLDGGKNQLVTAKFALGEGEVKVSGFQYWHYEYQPPKKLAWAKLLLPQITNAFKPPAKESIGHAQTAQPGAIAIGYGAGYSGEIAENKWFYNPGDGFFYYIGVLKPQTATPDLIESLSLSSAAGDQYSRMRFSLCINAEAIQATKFALASVDGWNLSGPLHDALATLCDEEAGL